MNKDNIKEYISIVESALRKIHIAKSAKKGKREVAIRKAKEEAQKFVFPYKDKLINLCQKENLGDELFDWGPIESDLHDVYTTLTDLYNKKIKKYEINLCFSAMQIQAKNLF